jgi:hypothetical protein
MTLHPIPSEFPFLSLQKAAVQPQNFFFDVESWLIATRSVPIADYIFSVDSGRSLAEMTKTPVLYLHVHCTVMTMPKYGKYEHFKYISGSKTTLEKPIFHKNDFKRHCCPFLNHYQ